MKYRLLFFFYFLSLVAIVLWQQVFHLPLSIISYHIVVAIAVHSAVLSWIAAVHRVVHSRWWAATLVGAWFFITLFFYLLIFGSVHYWGDIITIKILGSYFTDFRGFLHSMPFDYGQMVLMVLFFIAFAFLVVLPFSTTISNTLDDLWNSLLTHKRILVAIFIISVLASPLLLHIKRIMHHENEPVLVMLFDHIWGVTDNPLFSPERIKAGFHDKELRKKYQSTVSALPRKNVILILVDALRADHLSAYGYGRKTSPFIDSMIHSGKAAKVHRCYSTCACTLCGVPSILLSRTWQSCAINGFNLIGLLHDQGYPTYAIISGAHHDWYNMAKFYSDDCTMYFDGKESAQYYFKDDRLLLEGLERVKPYKDSASFFYFHLQSTHETGLLQDKYNTYKPFKRSLHTQDMNGQAAINEYDNKVLQADAIIRQLFAALDHKGYLKNSIVMITADHGQGLGEHGVAGHVDWLYDPQVSVPLIIYDDSLAAYHNLTFARQIDIAPTIIARLGLPIPSSWMGLPLTQPQIATYSYHETGKNGLETHEEKHLIVAYSDTAIYKYIYTTGYTQEELYEVLSDPEEKINLSKTKKEVIEQMRSARRSTHYLTEF